MHLLTLCVVVLSALFGGVAHAQESGLPIAISAGLSHGGWPDRISLDVPPAPNDAGPRVALAASHTVVDGVVGSGWTLEAGSVIVRQSTAAA